MNTCLYDFQCSYNFYEGHSTTAMGCTLNSHYNQQSEKGISMSLDLTFHLYLLFHRSPRINLFVSLSASENTYYMHITFISHLPFLWDVWTFALSPQCLPNPLNCHGVLQDEFVIQHYCWGWSQSHWDKKDEDNDIDNDDVTDDDNENASVTSLGQSICNFTHFAF